MHFISQPILFSAGISNMTLDYRLPIIERTENKHTFTTIFQIVSLTICQQKVTSCHFKGNGTLVATSRVKAASKREPQELAL